MLEAAEVQLDPQSQLFSQPIRKDNLQALMLVYLSVLILISFQHIFCRILASKATSRLAKGCSYEEKAF